jgi:threonine/homoserine/homoserine lactone efflux protein
MAVSSIAAFWAVAALLVAVPGADWAYVIGTVLSGRPVLLAVGGIAIGYAGITIVVAGGVGALVARTPASLTALTIAGGLYLLWLGVRAFLRPAGHGPAEGAAAARTDRATFVRGIGVSGLNPKGLLVFLAVLPQFATPHGNWPLTVQLGVLGLVFTLTCAAFYLGMGSVVHKILDGRPAVARVVSRFSAAAMIVLGVLLLAEHLLAGTF